jgi:hypothetical protein
LFDALVELVIERTAPEVAKGATFFDPAAAEPVVLRFLAGDVVDGNGEVVRRTMAAANAYPDGRVERVATSSLYDVIPPDDRSPRMRDDAAEAILSADDPELVMWARQHLFEATFQQAHAAREEVAAIQEDFLTRSFNAMLARADRAIVAADEEVDAVVGGAAGRLRKAELHRRQLEERRHHRLAETARGRQVDRGDVAVVGSALLLPLPPEEPASIGGGDAAGAANDAEVEQTAVRVARRSEEARGATVVSVEADNIGFDLLSTLGLERRCIEVKGRAGTGVVELTWSEFAKAQELGPDYWLFVVLDCASAAPRLYRVQDPARVLAGSWVPTLDVRYRVAPEPVIEAATSSG